MVVVAKEKAVAFVALAAVIVAVAMDFAAVAA
jgi:hypothetical protein